MQRRFRASSYKPVNRASSVTGANSVVCSYGKFQPSQDEFRKHNQILTRQKLCYFGRFVAKAKLFSLSKKFRPSHRAGLFEFIWENFHPGYRDVDHKTETSVSQPGFSYEHLEMLTKQRVARRDLGNRASKVYWAHMKRPLKPLSFRS